MHGRVALPVQQPFGARHPPAYRREQGGVEQQMQGDARGGARRREMVTAADRFGVEALPRVDRHVDVAGGVRGHREQFEGRSAQARCGVGRREQLVGQPPIAAAGSVAGAIQKCDVGRLGHRVAAVIRRTIFRKKEPFPP